jgi:Domain of unknown function (DUF4406)
MTRGILWRSDWNLLKMNGMNGPRSNTTPMRSPKTKEGWPMGTFKVIEEVNTFKPKVKRVYISGPMGGWENHNFPAFNEAADKLRNLGFEVENPADKGIVDGWVWTDYLRYDLAKLVECDALHLLPNWYRSPGSRLEVHVASQLGFNQVLADGEIVNLTNYLGYVEAFDAG